MERPGPESKHRVGWCAICNLTRPVQGLATGRLAAARHPGASARDARGPYFVSLTGSTLVATTARLARMASTIFWLSSGFSSSAFRAASRP